MKKIVLTAAERIILNETATEFFKKYQENHSQQNTQTPIDVVVDIISNLDVAGKSVLVVANFDVFICVQYLNHLFDLGITDLQLVTDVKLNFESDKIIYTESFKEIKLNKKFDVAILNPPYESIQKGGDRTTPLGAKIAINISKYVNYMAVILPYLQIRRVTESVPGYLVMNNVSHSFPSVKIKGGAFVSYFDCTQKELNIVKQHDLVIVANNLAKLWRGAENKRHIKSNVGNIELIVTATTRMYVSDAEYSLLQRYEFGRDKWKLVLSLNGGKAGPGDGTIGQMVIARPEDKAIGNIVVFEVKTEALANQLKLYLETDDVRNIVKTIKLAPRNKKEIFEYIPMPDFLK